MRKVRLVVGNTYSIVGVSQVFRKGEFVEVPDEVVETLLQAKQENEVFYFEEFNANNSTHVPSDTVVEEGGEEDTSVDIGAKDTKQIRFGGNNKKGTLSLEV